MGNTVAIHVHDLQKSYRQVNALTSVDLDVPTGTVFALLGPNGAGKTTAVRIMTTLLRPDGGVVEIDGVDALADPHAARNRIGLSGQYAAVDDILTGRENLTMIARLAGFDRRAARRRADALLERFDLAGVDKRVAAYSGGMRRRLDLACALVASPPVVILDEPTTGLDPNGRTELWKAIQELVADGTTVLLTTQYLEEADQFADSVAVLVGGTIVARGAPSELKRDYASDQVEVTIVGGQAAQAVEVLAANGFHGAAVSDGNIVRVAAADGRAALATTVAQLAGAGITVSSAASSTPTLDEVFVRLTAGVSA